MQLNVQQQLLSFDRPQVWGILNVTPDSFFDGGRYVGAEALRNRIEQLVAAGADIIDVGAVSTRPGADLLDTTTEWRRLIPALHALHQWAPHIPISVDTFRSEIAQRAIDAGAAIINDVSGGMADDQMLRTVARYRVPYVLMHSRGFGPARHPLHYIHVTTEVLKELALQRVKALQAGVDDLIIDPGFGFDKTLAHNYTLLDQLEAFHSFGCPLLVGLSRKSMVYKALGVTPEQALSGTMALQVQALRKGAHILRVHDVAEAHQAIALAALTLTSPHA